VPINMSCPSCAKNLSAPDTAAGKKAKCPACGTTMVIPTGVFDAEEIGITSLPPTAPGYDSVDGMPGAGTSQPSAASTMPGQEPARRPCPTCGELIIATAAKCRFCGAVFDARLVGSMTPRGQSYQGFGTPAERIQQIHSCFKTWWICLAVGMGLCITCIGAIIGIPVLIAGVVFHMMLLYKLWCVVQDGRAESTPEKAIGFLFIPFFNIYWQFVAIWGLSKDLNRYSRAYGIVAPEASESLALTVCILNCCSIIPYLGMLTAIASMIVAIIAVKGMRDTAVAIIQNSSAWTA